MSRRSRCSATDAESPDISAMLQLQTGQTTGLPVAGIAAESALAAVQALDALAVASAPLFTTGWSTLEEIAASDEPPLDVTADRLIVGEAERCAAKLAEE